MKMTINEIADCVETEVIINCRHADDEVIRLLSACREQDKKLSGVKDGRTYMIEPSSVLYFDTVDKRTFLYTRDSVLETDLRLYELEERLSSVHFFRASKSAIINIAKIVSITPDLGGRLEVTMESGERLPVSRQYANQLKSKLGI